MSIQSLIKKVCVQTAVYWAPAGNTGYGMSYVSPKEIKCRWDGSDEVLTDKHGKQIVANIEILCPEELATEGLLWLGELKDLSTAQFSDPLNLLGIQEISKVKKTPLFRSSTKFVYQIYV